MNPARFSVHRPVFTVMTTLIVMLFGIVSLLRLPIDLMPDITLPTLSVTTTYENASAEEVEELVTRPLEEALAAIPGVEELSSVSAEGQSQIRISFVWGTDLDTAANDIRDRIDRAMARLPEEADRPMLRKFDLASFPVLILGASSNLDPLQMRKILEDRVKYRIERVPGVAALDIWGGEEREIQVDLDLDRLRAFQVSPSAILARLRASNLDRPAGTIREGNRDLRIRVPGYFGSVEEIAETVILEREGVPVLLRDLAVVRDGIQKARQIVRVNGKPGIRLFVNKQSGTNTVEVAEAVLEELQRIRRDIPQVEIVPIINSSKYIRQSLQNVGIAALYGGCLAVLVLLFFLRDLRSTAVIAVSIPVSIVATFAMIYFSGFTLNIMTLGGLALGIGMLVDNAIVVLENITRIRGTLVGTTDKRGIPLLAAEYGTSEVMSAIVASTLTTVVVFLPLIFMRGMAGVMFKQFSLVIAFALLCSLLTAATLVPMLASRLLQDGEGAPPSRMWDLFFQWSARKFEAMEEGYRRLLHFSLDHKAFVIGCAVVLLGGSGAMVKKIGTELLPKSDEGEIRIEGEMEVGTAVDVLDRTFQQIEALVRKEVPEIESMISSVGGGGFRVTAKHTGYFRIALVPQRQRKRSSEAIANALRPKVEEIPGLTARTRAGQGLFIMRMATPEGDAIAVEIRGYDFDIASNLALQVKRLVEGVPGVTDARISRDPGAPEERIRIDRRKAADLGLTVEDIAQTLEIVLGGVSAGFYREGGDAYRILVQDREAEFRPLEEILDLTLTNRMGVPVVLRNVVHVEPAQGPAIIERKNQERIITVTANFTGRDMGSVIADIRERLRDLPLPPGFDIVFGGDYEEQQKSFRELLFSLILAVILVYMVMACQFESLRDPFVVMFSVPLAAIGVVWILFLTKTTFNIQSFIGCIMLAGIVVNNAILLVDHTNLLRHRDQMALREAIEEAGRRRLRPILMTALTTCLGLFPLALGLGEGGETQAPMARAVIGGLLVSTLITLVVVPVVYAIFERARSGATTELPR